MTNKSQIMSDEFDHEAGFDEKIRPHIDAIFEACEEMDIPCLLSVCYANKPREDGAGASTGQSVAVHFVGQERTPPTMYMAERALMAGPQAAVAFAIEHGLLSGYSQVEHSRESIGPKKPFN
jgi:hypothetical protein